MRKNLSSIQCHRQINRIYFSTLFQQAPMFLQQIRLPNVLVRRMHVIVPPETHGILNGFRLDDYFKDQ